MKRRHFIASLGAATAAWPLVARAQRKPMPVIGFLASTSAGAGTEQLVGIRQGLGETGYVEGQSFAFEHRWAKGAYGRLPAMAADLVARKVDVIIAQAPPAAHAAKAATTTIPVVFGVGIDPVAEGLVGSLARPGGNLTGVTLQISDLMPKRFALMTELVPKARLIALLVSPKNPNPWIGSVEATAHAKGVRVMIVKAGAAGEVDAAFATMVQERAEALVIAEDSFLATWPQVAELALRHRIPTIGLIRRFAEIGGLVSYGTNLTAAYRQIGAMAGRILKGAKPADLAVQRPVRFEMVLNMKTAKALGLTIAPLVLAQADEVIE